MYHRETKEVRAQLYIHIRRDITVHASVGSTLEKRCTITYDDAVLSLLGGNTEREVAHGW